MEAHLKSLGFQWDNEITLNSCLRGQSEASNSEADKLDLNDPQPETQELVEEMQVETADPECEPG